MSKDEFKRKLMSAFTKGYTKGLEEGSKKQGISKNINKFLSDLIILCHPDKHNNNSRSQRTFLRLIEFRDKIKSSRK